MVFNLIYKLRSLFKRKRKNLDPNNYAITTFDLVIVLLSFLALIIFVIEAFAVVDPEYKQLFYYIDYAFCIIFMIDFIIHFSAAKNKLQFLKWGWIDLLSAIPGIEYFRWGRIFRLFRLLKAISSVHVLQMHFLQKKKNGMISIAIISFIMVLVFSSILVLYFENTPESNIKTAEDAIWWTFTTITTVGYGDRFPVTTEGRIVGILTMVVGISVFSIVTAYIASKFINQSECKEKT